MLKCMCAVPSMAVFSSSLMSCLPLRYTLLRYFLNDFEMFLVAPRVTGVTFAFNSTYAVFLLLRSLYFRIFSAYFLMEFRSPAIATATNIYALFFIFTDYDVRSIVRDFCPFAVVPHLHDLFGLIYVHGRTGFHYLILLLFPCICSGVAEHNLYHVSLCIFLLPNTGHADTM
jgi:hypothetical protein